MGNRNLGKRIYRLVSARAWESASDNTCHEIYGALMVRPSENQRYTLDDEGSEFLEAWLEAALEEPHTVRLENVIW